jgi:mycothiol synthase
MEQFPVNAEPQLRMRQRRLDTLPAVALPEGIACRVFRAGDEEQWAAVLNGCGELGSWDRLRVERALAGGIAPERIWFLCAGDRPIATACVCVHGSGAEIQAEIGWVAALPEHQGRRLGRQITLAACLGARALGFNEVFLLTDDHRLPAIKTYLNLGFEPDLWHESHPGRWQAIMQRLSEQSNSNSNSNSIRSIPSYISSSSSSSMGRSETNGD